MSQSDEDQFQPLEYEQIDLEQPNSIQKYVPTKYDQPSKSIIKHNKQFKENVFKVEIKSSQNKIDMNILENQFYLVKVLKKGAVFKDNIQRRYSDFDLLYEIIEKNYPGFILPAFPEKGIVSYVKTKVSVTKDENFLKTRIKVIERFFNELLNMQKFNVEKCIEIKKFFSKDEQYQLFKKRSKQQLARSKSIVDSTWGIIKDFFKINQTSKYTPIIEEVKKEKVPFENLLSKAQQILELINDEFQANEKLIQCQNSGQHKRFIPKFPQFLQMVTNYSSEIEALKQKLINFQFILNCQNQDYLMVLKKIQLIEQMRQSEQNYKNLPLIESEFDRRRNEIQAIKVIQLQQAKQNLANIIQKVNQIQRNSYNAQ